MAVGSGSRSVQPTKGRTGGRQTVMYRNVDGQNFSAVVTGGTGTALNLYVPSLPKAQQRKTAIAKATAPKETNVWR